MAKRIKDALRQSAGVVVVVALSLVALWGVLFYDLKKSEEAAFAQAHRDAANMALAFREHVQRTIGAIDDLMISIIGANEESRRWYRIPQWINDIGWLKGIVVQVGIAGPQGDILASNLSSSNPISIFDRAHFRHHLDLSAPQPYISVPVVGRISKQTTVQVTRRMVDNKGAFRGVMVFSIDPGYLTRFLGDLALDDQGVVNLAGLDGIVRARRTKDGNVAGGQDLSRSAVFTKLRTAPVGSFESDGVVDGVKRVHGYARVPNYPLVVITGQGEREILKGVREKRSNYYMAGSSLTVIVLLVAGAWIGMRQRERHVREALQSDADAKVREQKVLLDATLNNLSLGVLMFDAGGKIRIWNQRYLELYNLPDDFVKLGWSARELIHARVNRGSLSVDDVDSYCDEMEQAFLARDTRSRMIVTSDGRIINVVHQPMPDGGTVVTHEDITDKARAEMTLSESRAQFSDLFELAPIGLLLVGDSGRIELANKEAGQIFGYVADDMIGMMIENLVPEKDRRSDEGLRHAFKASGKLQGTMVMRDEVSALRKDGSIVPTEVKLSPINILGERHTCVVVRDLTERKAVDAQLRQAQKMEAVGQLTGGLAHDFNNLLMIMIGNLEVLQALSQDPQQNELLDLVLDAATRGADLTQRLLAFSRRQPLQADVCDINELLNATTALLRRTIGENVTVDLQLSSDALTASVDRGQFESVILNMAINARDAMPSGGVVTIATKMMAVASDADAKAYGDVGWGEYVAIVISDTGSGMSPEVVARVFEPFFTTKGKGKGTGLGLSMVYGFIKQSGGGIKIDSELGCGTSITLLLPLAVTEAQASTGALASSGTDVQPKANVILAVDDNHAVRETAVRNLRSLGYQVVEAKNADEAMQKLESGEKIDLLFTDIIMPGELDGIGLAKWARTRYPNLKILYTSGFPGTEEGRSEVQQVDGRLLQKPYRRKGLQEAVEQVLAAA